MTKRRCPTYLVLVVATTCAVTARAADGYADGWTPQGLGEAIASCTDELVAGAWERTKRDQGVDAATPMTPEIRKQLEPQIAAFRALCDCTVKATAKKYGRAAYRKDPDAVGRYAQDLVKRGVCKPGS